MFQITYCTSLCGFDFIVNLSRDEPGDIFCRFQHSESITTASLLSSSALICPVPVATHQSFGRDVQEVYILGQEPGTVHEIQILSPKSLLSSYRIVVTTNCISPEDRAQVVRVILSSETSMGGTFVLNHPSGKTPPIPIDASEEKMREMIQSIFDEVTISRVDDLPTLRVFHAWDITIKCVAGGIDLADLVCNTNGVRTLWDNQVDCVILQQQSTNSTALDGYFQLSRGEEGILHTIPFDANPSIIREVLESMSYSVIAVHKSSWPENISYNTGSSWLVTLDLDNGPPFNVHGNMLEGTRSTCSVHSEDDSTRDRPIELIVDDGFHSETLTFERNISVSSLKNELESLSLLTNVNVTREVFADYIEWVFHVTSIRDSTNFFAHDDFKAVLIQDEVLIEPVHGYISLSFAGEESQPIEIRSGASDMREALMALNTVGDVDVTFNASAADIGTGLRGLLYTITFTTLGFPENVGDLPLIQINSSQLSGSYFLAKAKKVASGCCDVAVSFNGVDYFSNSSAFFTYDELPVVTSIIPSHGFTTGLTDVIVEGIGFTFAGNSANITCIFGDIEVDGMLLDSGRATCTSPPFVRALVFVTLKLFSSDSAMISQSKATFEFVPVPKVIKTVPAILPDGDLGVIGTDFVDSADLTCRILFKFENATELMFHTQAAFYNASYLECLTHSSTKHPQLFNTNGDLSFGK